MAPNRARSPAAQAPPISRPPSLAGAPAKAKAPTRATLTARQAQLLRRMPSRPTPTDLAALSDAGLRALLVANGLPRRSAHRRGDYVAALAGWLAEDDTRQLTFPPTVERAPGGEPAPPSAHSCPPPGPTDPTPATAPDPSASRSEIVPALAEVGAILRAVLAAIHADHAAEDGVGGGLGVGGAG